VEYARRCVDGKPVKKKHYGKGEVARSHPFWRFFTEAESAPYGEYNKPVRTDAAEYLAEERGENEDKKRPEKTPEKARSEKIDLFSGLSEAFIYGDNKERQSDKLYGGDKGR